VKHSSDEGRTWSASQRLTLNPFFNLSSLVRNGPIYARDGRIGLPVYFEMATKFPQMLWLTPGPGGRLSDYRMRNLATETDLIQPTLIPLGEDRVLMLLRDGSMKHRMHTSYSADNGWTWSGAQATPIPNSDSAIDALRLRDGRILVVYNHADERRENLRVALSNDEGRSWTPGIILEQQTAGEFSYPCLMEDALGRIHLTYTWQRRRIKHLEFNVAWLNHRSLAQADASP
jgi:predicted neuraminidase